MREIVGFVMGAAAGAAGALFATSTEGRALLERLKEDARPEAERAATEWEPVLREVGRAVRLAARELEAASVELRARIGEIAADRPDDDVALAMTEPEPATAPEPAAPVPFVDAPADAVAVPDPVVSAPADEPAPTT